MRSPHPGTLTLLLLAAACAGSARRGGDPSPSAVALPREPSRSPDGSSGWEVPVAARMAERNRCIDGELARRGLNEYGEPLRDPKREPLEVSNGTERHDYVMRRHRDIATRCTRAPGGTEW